jgi:gamma-glutamyltranspeptidase / glutathione hydrolase
MDYSTSARSFRIRTTDGTSFQPRIFGRRGVLASQHYLASIAGIDMLKAGGNAVDAAVAATLVEGVVNPQMHTIGGELPILIHAPDTQKPICINGNLVAPAAAKPAAFSERGFDKIPPEGVLAAGVPGAMAALLAALRRYGRMPFSEIAAPARDLARDGFPVHSGLLRQHGFGICANADKFRTEWTSSAEVYLPQGKIPEEGQIIQNQALAGMLDYLIGEERLRGASREAGIDAVFTAFYKGDVAKEMVAFVEKHGGLLKRSDFDRFEVPFEQPTSLHFEGVDLYKTGPWSQGPALLQALSILKSFDLSSLGHNSAAYIHLIVEVIKLAFSDREQFYADPDHTDVPIKNLLDDRYGQLRSTLIGKEASISLRPGDPRALDTLLNPVERLGGSSWGRGTVHVDAMDNDGLAAAFTPSGAWIKSSEVIPSLGFPLGTRLSNFQLSPTHHPNIVAPFKRPRTTISPSLAAKDGKPWLAFGSMGGAQQDQWQLQFFLNRVVFGMSIRQAIDAPKFSSEHFPGFFHPQSFFLNRLRVEETIGDDIVQELREKGHDVGLAPAWTEGFLCATEHHVGTGILEAAADLRGNKSEVFPATALGL